MHGRSPNADHAERQDRELECCRYRSNLVFNTGACVDGRTGD